MKKKALSLVLALIVCLGLVLPASAANVALSPQKLTVNGVSVDCEKYNINGANYFKLRDLAYLLNGTGSQFGVGYDAVTNTVTITTGTTYAPNDTELVTGVDNSGSAERSNQTILINGVARSDLSVYNIGGSNFFQLRELGSLLGFTVDYDAVTNTAIILTSGTTPEPKPVDGPLFDSTAPSDPADLDDLEGEDLLAAVGMGTAGIHAWSEENGTAGDPNDIPSYDPETGAVSVNPVHGR